MSPLHDRDIPKAEPTLTIPADAKGTSEATPPHWEATKLSSRLTPGIHKALFSSPTQVVGTYDDGDTLVRPAFGAYGESAWRPQSRPSNRWYYSLAFVAEDEVTGPGGRPHRPDHSHVIENFLVCLSVLLGKQFDNHGLIESHRHIQAPIIDAAPTIRGTHIKAFDNAPRGDVPTPLEFGQIAGILGVFSDTAAARLVETFFTAGRLYARALRTWHMDPDAAYVNLVMCGEAISQFLDLDTSNLYDDELKAALARLQQLGARDSDLSLIRSRLLQVKRRYTASLHGLLNEGFFLHSESRLASYQLTPENIRGALDASYDLRSNYVHRGGSLLGFLLFNSDGNEMAIGIPAVEDRALHRTFKSAPTFSGLERVMRFCLLRLLHINGISISPLLA